MPLDVVCDHLKHTKKCNKPRTLLSFLYVYSIHCVKLLSKYLDANVKQVLGMEFATDEIALVL